MILIDTNIYSASVKGVKDAVDIMKQSDLVLIPTIVVGELKSGFLGGNRNKENSEVFEKFLSDNKIQIPSLGLKTTDIYAELALYARNKGRVLSNNDLWIAAIAKENNVKLVTYDKDFEVFSDIFNDRLIILS